MGEHSQRNNAIDGAPVAARDERTDWDPRYREFQRLRTRLFGIAYRMLGSRTDAEDILQEAYLRWHRTALQAVRSPEAWLVTSVTRLCIDRLRRARAERETYVGPWLPEPLVTDTASAADAELATDLSIAFLVVLERLAPHERAAFLLRELFDSDYGEIAQVLGKSEVACRQIVNRARRRVRAERPRVLVNPAANRSLLERFTAAIRAQDKQELLKLFSEETSWTSDGGGKARAARRVIRGREAVVRFALAALGRHAGQLRFVALTINAEPALALLVDGRLHAVITIRTDGVQICDVFAMLNPDKLRGIQLPAAFPHDRVEPAPSHAPENANTH
jgi:RNA polymerase sigma-70 factor (ECF subfamily)